MSEKNRVSPDVTDACTPGAEEVGEVIKDQRTIRHIRQIEKALEEKPVNKAVFLTFFEFSFSSYSTHQVSKLEQKVF